MSPIAASSVGMNSMSQLGQTATCAMARFSVGGMARFVRMAAVTVYHCAPAAEYGTWGRGVAKAPQSLPTDATIGITGKVNCGPALSL
jgi:hypothetical protein